LSDIFLINKTRNTLNSEEFFSWKR